MSRKYNNWKREPKDKRDHILSISSTTPLREAIDLSNNFSKVEDQGQLGSCTGNAIVGMMEYLQILKTPQLDFSRLFIYYNERVVEGTVNEDAGAIIRDGIKTLVSNGVCEEKIWPYVEKNFSKKPAVSAYNDAKKHKISSYKKIINLDDMLQTLNSARPFVFGFEVFSYFESDEMEKTGILKMPEKNEASQGGHAVCAVGYNLKTKMIKVRNSWGEEWGDKGYFYMPFDYISNPDLADDFWTITL